MGHTGGSCPLLLTFGNLCLSLHSSTELSSGLLPGVAVAAGASLCPEQRGDGFALMPWSILPGHSCSFLLVVVTEDTEEAHPCSQI